MKLHLATCTWWVTMQEVDCTCSAVDMRPWRIRKQDTELFPWAVYRRTGAHDEGAYERLMSCSSFAGATQLVTEFMRLSRTGLRSDESV